MAGARLVILYCGYCSIKIVIIIYKGGGYIGASGRGRAQGRGRGIKVILV